MQRHEESQAQRRKEEFQRGNLIKGLKQNVQARGMVDSEAAAGMRRRKRIAMELRQERAVWERHQALHNERAERAARQAQEEAETAHVKHSEDAKTCAQKYRQLLWDTSPELKDLKQRFLTAATFHGQKKQIALKGEKAEDSIRHVGLFLSDHDVDEDQKEREERESGKRYGEDLLRQLAQKKAERDHATQKEEIEQKKIIESLLRSIEEDTRRESAAKQQSKEEYRKAALEGIAERQRQITHDQRYQTQLECDIASFEGLLAERKSRTCHAHETSITSRAARTSQVFTVIEEGLRKAQDVAKLRSEYYQEERERKDRELAELEGQGDADRKRQLLNEQLEHLQAKRRTAEEARTREREVELKLEALAAEQDGIRRQKESTERKARLQRERQDMGALLLEREQLARAEKERVRQEEDYLRYQEQARRDLVEEERQRFLQEEAAKYGMQLPKDLLRDEQDWSSLAKRLESLSTS